jgi:hypothetical protein
MGYTRELGLALVLRTMHLLPNRLYKMPDRAHQTCACWAQVLCLLRHDMLVRLISPVAGVIGVPNPRTNIVRLSSFDILLYARSAVANADFCDYGAVYEGVCG